MDMFIVTIMLCVFTVYTFVIGLLIGDAKKRPVLGGFLGFMFGLIGIIIIALIPKKKIIKHE